jgi:hypothetical protein
VNKKPDVQERVRLMCCEGTLGGDTRLREHFGVGKSGMAVVVVVHRCVPDADVPLVDRIDVLATVVRYLERLDVRR